MTSLPKGPELDYGFLANATARFEEMLALYGSDPQNGVFRDALIQRFELTYDLAHKMLRHTLAANAASPDEIYRMSFPTLIRTGGEQGLIGTTWPQWHTWREMRNITSHTYDETKAREVATKISSFLPAVRDMLFRLQGGTK